MNADQFSVFRSKELSASTLTREAAGSFETNTSQITRPNAPAGHELNRLKMFEDRMLSVILECLKVVQAGGWRSCIKAPLCSGYILIVGHLLGPLGWLNLA
jgi:hypothetical protein